MLFHAGALLRMSEIGWLERLDLVSSVSGGSIIAAQLALQWEHMKSGSGGFAQGYRDGVLDPLLRLSKRTIDVPALVVGGLVPGSSCAGRVAAAYRKHLFGKKTLRDLPEHPRFVINATNVQTGALFRFSRPYARDYKLGGIPDPAFEVATAVAASSAFPPFLSPVVMHISPKAWKLPGEYPELNVQPFNSKIVLSDGGIYDNLGLEAAKRSTTVLVSDGGGRMAFEAKPDRNWLGQLRRVLSVEDNQVRALRKRWLIARYRAKEIEGAYWGIRTDPADRAGPLALPCPYREVLRLAALPTRLAPPGRRDELRLVNWGYAAFDATARKYVDPSLEKPANFPYPDEAL